MNISNEDAEKLIPVVARLASLYTSKESSSISYDTAGLLFEAALYCINELKSEYSIVIQKEIDVMALYDRGYEAVIEKVKKSKAIFDIIINHYEDYGSKCYYETIALGMPEFFKWYDARFKPMNHILSLDYPVLISDSTKCGIDRIYEYLSSILAEQKLLAVFDTALVKEILNHIMPEYKELYMDNILFPVLMHTLASLITEHSIDIVGFNSEEYDMIRDFFSDDNNINTKEKIEEKSAALLKLTFKNKLDEDTITYSEGAIKDMAAVIYNALENNVLENIFF